MFCDVVLRVPCKADEGVGILYSVLNNLPVPVIIFNNENWRYGNNIIFFKWNP
jgi:hypothetical protein